MALSSNSPSFPRVATSNSRPCSISLAATARWKWLVPAKVSGMSPLSTNQSLSLLMTLTGCTWPHVWFWRRLGVVPTPSKPAERRGATPQENWSVDVRTRWTRCKQTVFYNCVALPAQSSQLTYLATRLSDLSKVTIVNSRAKGSQCLPCCSILSTMLPPPS